MVLLGGWGGQGGWRDVGPGIVLPQAGSGVVVD